MGRMRRLRILREQSDESIKQSDLFKLALLDEPTSPTDLENDIANLAQVTQDHLKGFIRGKTPVGKLHDTSSRLKSLSGDISQAAEEIINKTDEGYTIPKDAKQKLSKINKKFKTLPPSVQQRALDNIDDIESAVTAEKPQLRKKGEDIAHHVATYAVTGARGTYRVAAKDDAVRGRLHVFKRGNEYVGFLEIPGRTRSESTFTDKLSLVLEASKEPLILTHKSKKLQDVFQLSNYDQEAPEMAKQLDRYGSEIETLNPGLADRLKASKLRLGKNKPKESPQEEEQEQELDYSSINKLSKHYYHRSLRASDKYRSTIYELISEKLTEILSLSDLKNLITMIENNIKRYKKRPLFDKDPEVRRIIGINKAILSDLRNLLPDK